MVLFGAGCAAPLRTGLKRHAADSMHDAFYDLLRAIANRLRDQRYSALDEDGLHEAISRSWEEIAGPQQDYDPLRLWLDSFFKDHPDVPLSRMVGYFLSRSLVWSIMDVLRKSDPEYFNMRRRVKRWLAKNGDFQRIRTPAGWVIFLSDAEAIQLRNGEPWAVEEVERLCEGLGQRLPRRGLDKYLPKLFAAVSSDCEKQSMLRECVLVQALASVQRRLWQEVEPDMNIIAGQDYAEGESRDD